MAPGQQSQPKKRLVVVGVLLVGLGVSSAFSATGDPAGVAGGRSRALKKRGPPARTAAPLSPPTNSEASDEIAQLRGDVERLRLEVAALTQARERAVHLEVVARVAQAQRLRESKQKTTGVAPPVERALRAVAETTLAQTTETTPPTAAAAGDGVEAVAGNVTYGQMLQLVQAYQRSTQEAAASAVPTAADTTKEAPVMPSVVTVKKSKDDRAKYSGFFMSRERCESWCDAEQLDPRTPDSVKAGFVEAMNMDAATPLMSYNENDAYDSPRMAVDELSYEPVSGRLKLKLSDRLLRSLLSPCGGGIGRGVEDARHDDTGEAYFPRGVGLRASVNRARQYGLFADLVDAPDFDAARETCGTFFAHRLFGFEDRGRTELGVPSVEWRWTRKYLGPVPSSLDAPYAHGDLARSDDVAVARVIGLRGTKTAELRESLVEQVDACGANLWRRWEAAVVTDRREISARRRDDEDAGPSTLSDVDGLDVAQVTPANVAAVVRAVGDVEAIESLGTRTRRAASLWGLFGDLSPARVDDLVDKLDPDDDADDDAAASSKRDGRAIRTPFTPGSSSSSGGSVPVGGGGGAWTFSRDAARRRIERKLVRVAKKWRTEAFETRLARERVEDDGVAPADRWDAVRFAHRSNRATALGALLALDHFLDRDAARRALPNPDADDDDDDAAAFPEPVDVFDAGDRALTSPFGRLVSEMADAALLAMNTNPDAADRLVTLEDLAASVNAHAPIDAATGRPRVTQLDAATKRLLALDVLAEWLVLFDRTFGLAYEGIQFALTWLVCSVVLQFITASPEYQKIQSPLYQVGDDPGWDAFKGGYDALAAPFVWLGTNVKDFLAAFVAPGGDGGSAASSSSGLADTPTTTPWWLDFF